MSNVIIETQIIWLVGGISRDWSFRLKNKKEIKREVMDRLVDRHKAVTGLDSSQLRFCIDGYGGGCRHHNRKVKT